MFYSNTDKLILKTDCDSENKTKYPDNSDNSSDINDFLKLFFFYSYSTYYFRMSRVIFDDARRRRFDQISINPFRASR